MKKLFFLLIITHGFACKTSNNRLSNLELAKVANLLKEGRISQAELLLKSKVCYDKKCEVDFRLANIIIYFKKGQFPESYDKALLFIQKYPLSTFGYYYAGLCQFNLNSPTKALGYFQNALNIDNESPKGGFVYRDNKGATRISNIFSEDAIYYDLNFMTAACKNLLGDYISSQSIIQFCIDRGYKLSESHMIMGINCEKLKDIECAKKNYRIAVFYGNKEAELQLNKL